MKEYKFITDEDKKIIEQLNISDHVVHAFDSILKEESNYKSKNKKIHNFQDLVIDALQRRAELYYKYNI